MIGEMPRLAAALQCPLSNAETTVGRDNPGEGGEGIPEWSDESGIRVGYAECQVVSTDGNNNLTQKEGENHVERNSSVREGRRGCFGC